MDSIIMRKALLVFAAAVTIMATGCAGGMNTVSTDRYDFWNAAFDDDPAKKLELQPDPRVTSTLGTVKPGVPVRLPAKIIRVYYPPSQSPMGRLVGEHHVWAVVQEETWATPQASGLDTVVPSEIATKERSK